MREKKLFSVLNLFHNYVGTSALLVYVCFCNPSYSADHALETSDTGCRPDDGKFSPKHVALKLWLLYILVCLDYEFDPPIQFTPSG